MADLNLTPLRLRALRIIQQQPYMTAQDLGYELDPREDRKWNHPAQATRWGAKQVTALIKAGLVRTSDYHQDGLNRVSAGWKTLRITDKGLAAIGSPNGGSENG